MAGAAVIYIIWAIEAAIMGVLVYRYVHSQPMILLEPAMSNNNHTETHSYIDNRHTPQQG